MRVVVLVCALIGLAGQAVAADYRVLQTRDQFVRPGSDRPVLRGSHVFEPREPDFVRWDGFYAGGQFAYGSAHANLSAALRPLIVDTLRDAGLIALEQQRQISHLSVVGEAEAKGSGFGAFIGYNSQWQDAVMGVELNYTRTSINIVAPRFPRTLPPLVVGANTYEMTVSGAASLRLTDLATLRARSGWVFGSMMPYATAGFALARANLRRSVDIELAINGGVPFTLSATDNQNDTFMYGVALGGGIEYGLTAGTFLRGEYEFTQYMRIGDTRIAPHSHIVRTGLGMRF